MRRNLRLILLTTPVVASGTSSNRAAAQAPAIASIGPLTFAPDGTLFAADTAGTGTLWAAGLSNEEFSSKLRGIAC